MADDEDDIDDEGICPPGEIWEDCDLPVNFIYV